MKPEEVLLKRAEEELIRVEKYINNISDDFAFHPSIQAYNKATLLGVKSTLNDLNNFNDRHIFVDRSDVFAKKNEPTPPEGFLRSVQHTLHEMAKYLEWQEDNLDIISECDVKKKHLRMSQQVSKAWVKVRDWNQKGARCDEESEEVKTPQPLDINKQAKIKTIYGSILVIGKDQEELTKEKTEGYGYKHMGYCHECNATTWRIKVEEIGAIPRGGGDVCIPVFECEECAQEVRDIRERNAYVNRMHKENNSQLF